MTDTPRIEHWPDTMYLGRSWVPRHEAEARLRALREELAPLRALAVEAKEKRPELDSRWANLATARHHHEARLEGWAREYADRLAALAPQEGTDGVA